jgi:cytochrome oxidase assembly protein ShyY1
MICPESSFLSVAFKARLAAQFADAPIPSASLPADTAAARYRRIRRAGTWDHTHEVLLVSRTHQGSPGVNFVTPLRRAGANIVIDRRRQRSA